MEMGDKNSCYNSGGNFGKDELSLRAFAWVEEEPLIIPAHKVGAMVSVAGGLLA